MPTARQEIAAQLIVEKRRKKGEALLEAGYSPNTAIKPSQVTNSAGYKEAEKPFLEMLRLEKESALEAMDKKREKASYADVRQAVESFTKLEQLLTGEATENVAVNIIEKFEVKD